MVIGIAYENRESNIAAPHKTGVLIVEDYQKDRFN
jgi:hypothetical protein